MSATSADGSWNVTLNTPMGARPASLKLKTEGDVLGGTMESPQGAMEIEDGKIDGDRLSWVANMTQPMPMKLEFTATLDGDKISGEVDLGTFGKASFEGSRA